jgi:hypothetical protein
LYVGDFAGLKKINLSTAAVTVLNATSVQDLTTDGTSLYTINGNAIQKVDPVTGVISLYAGTVGTSTTSATNDGIGGAATFFHPNSIACDGTSLFVTQWIGAGFANLSLRRIDIASATVSSITSVSGAVGIATDGSKIFYVDGNANTLRYLQ